MAATQDRELVTVATFDMPMSATVVRNALAAEGIPAVVVDSDVAMLLSSEAVGGAKVRVPAPYAAEAALKIAAYDAAGRTETFDMEELGRRAVAVPLEDA